MTRRVFVGQSLAAGSAVVLARSLPAWAAPVEDGVIERMGRIAFDPEAKRTWISLLHVDVSTRPVATEFGPTRVSDARDRIDLIPGGLGPTAPRFGVSAGLPHAKLDPRLDARNGRVGVTWCGMDLDSKQWTVYASIFSNQPGPPVAVAGGERPTLHPELALDPHSERAYLVFEDWSDGSIRLSVFDGLSWDTPLRVSEGGRNYRPRVIVTRAEGKNRGAVAVAWDSYRDGQYDVYLRLVSADGLPGPELRASESAEWDNDACLAEDRDGNLWVAWIRAATEFSNYDGLRVVHARFWDGDAWRWPMPPAGMAADGRLTGRATTMHPSLLVDDANRVHLFYRDLEGMMWGVLKVITYAGDRWTGPRRVRDQKIQDALNLIWDYSSALDDHNRIITIWDSLYVKRLGLAAAVHPTLPLPLPPRPAVPFVTKGATGKDSGRPGWPKRPRLKPARMEIDGKDHVLLFGDTHSHSWTSDGIDPADWYYHFARDVAGLDYYALSDHDLTICNTPGLEAYIAFLPKAFNRPDFVCFQAYEFTSQKTGHRVVVFEGDDRPTFSFTRPPQQYSNTNDELYPFLRRFALAPDARVLVTAHNMAQLGNNFTGLDTGLEPLYDVTSLWTLADMPYRERQSAGDSGNGGIWVVIGKILGLGKTPEQKALWNTCWRDCLDDGLRLGAWGGSDTHAANGLGFVVSGVWAEGKERRLIFDAMHGRRTLAVDSGLRLDDCEIRRGAEFVKKDDRMLRPELRFEIEGSFMGLTAAPSGPPTARVVAAATDQEDPISAVVIVKDGRDAVVFAGEGKERVEVEWRDDDFSPGRHYYYARAEFASGKIAFSSPVFMGFGS